MGGTSGAQPQIKENTEGAKVEGAKVSTLSESAEKVKYFIVAKVDPKLEENDSEMAKKIKQFESATA